jgi:hypothetical protein
VGSEGRARHAPVLLQCGSWIISGGSGLRVTSSRSDSLAQDLPRSGLSPPPPWVPSARVEEGEHRPRGPPKRRPHTVRRFGIRVLQPLRPPFPHLSSVPALG